MENRKNILLTGATGIMGFEGFRQLLQNESFYLTLLVKPGRKNRKKLKKYLNHNRVRIVWGDLQSYADIENAMQGIDIVLHVGGMVSPKADKYPELTMRVNVLSVRNIVDAIKSQPDPGRVKLVYIGSVAQMGHKDVPDHFGCTSDIMNPARFDHYAVSKIMAEKVIAESGLQYWVSLRQTGILYPGLVLKGMDSITFHVPLKGVLEWVTLEDSGRVLVKLCEKDLPEDFWRKFYNISSGKSFRMTNYEFESRLLRVISCPPPEKIFEPKWFATKNFHGCWYSDAGLLEQYLNFRGTISSDDYFQNVIKSKIPWYFKIIPFIPPVIIKAALRKIAHGKGEGTMHWIKSNDQQKIETYFESREEWEKIPGWKDFDKTGPDKSRQNDKEKHPLFSKPVQEWGIGDMKNYAAYLNGRCLSDSMSKGDIDTSLYWENESGDRFHASPRYVVFGGYFPDHTLWSEIARYSGMLGLEN